MDEQYRHEEPVASFLSMKTEVLMLQSSADTF